MFEIISIIIWTRLLELLTEHKTRILRVQIPVQLGYVSLLHDAVKQ